MKRDQLPIVKCFLSTFSCSGSRVECLELGFNQGTNGNGKMKQESRECGPGNQCCIRESDSDGSEKFKKGNLSQRPMDQMPEWDEKTVGMLVIRGSGAERLGNSDGTGG